MIQNKKVLPRHLSGYSIATVGFVLPGVSCSTFIPKFRDPSPSVLAVVALWWNRKFCYVSWIVDQVSVYSDDTGCHYVAA